MRILLITSSYPPVLGGLQTVVHELARQFEAQGHQVQVVTSRYPRSLPAREVLDGICVTRYLFLKPSLDQLRTGRPDLFLAGLVFGPLTLFRLRRLARQFRPDVVNLHFPLSQTSFVLALLNGRQFPLVVSLHGNEILTWFGAGRKPFRSFENIEPGFTRSARARSLCAVLREATMVTACSRWLLGKAALLESSVAQKGVAIHNGIDASRFLDHSTASRERPYIFAFGRLTPLKGFDLLLTAFAELASTWPGIDLVIGGDGEEQDALALQAVQSGLASRIIFAGRLDPPGVVRYLNGCLFLVVPSRCEPFGIVALEGLAAGKAVLAADAGGVTEILGVQIVPATVAGLREGMAAWLAVPPVAASRHLAETFSWPYAADRYLATYQAVVQK